MGLDPNSLRFVLDGHAVGVDYSRTLMIGRQRLNLGSSEFHDALLAFGFDMTREDAAKVYSKDGRYADDFFRLLGATEVGALDNSAYQGASVVHDLNQPLAGSPERYSAVVDCGTLEHIFDVPTALKSCMEMVAEGGHYLCVVPANNFLGHGFYQFSPEFFFRVLCSDNGFSVVNCVVFTDDTISRWYSVADPDSLGRRVTLCNSSPTYIAVLAKRDQMVELFRSAPQQSDYVKVWAEAESEPEPVASIGVEDKGKIDLRLLVPERVKSLVRQRLGSLRRRLRQRGQSGFDPAFFRRVDQRTR